MTLNATRHCSKELFDMSAGTTTTQEWHAVFRVFGKYAQKCPQNHMFVPHTICYVMISRVEQMGHPSRVSWTVLRPTTIVSIHDKMMPALSVLVHVEHDIPGGTGHEDCS